MTDQLHQIDIPMDDVNVTRELFGINDIFLRRIEEQLDVKLVARGGQIFVKGEKHDIVETVLNNLLAIVESGISLTDRKSTRLNSSHVKISYAVFCLKK